MLDDAAAMLQSKKASYDLSLQNAKNLRASIQASEATMKLADRQLRDTEIRAPFDGYVEKRLVNLGELVKTQMPVMAVVRVDPLKVIAEIPEKMAPWIHEKEAVELHVDAYPDRAFTGKVSRISPAVNTATRAFPFEALVPNKDAVLKPGTFARVHIESGKVDDVITLPYASLQYRYGVNRVFVVEGDQPGRPRAEGRRAVRRPHRDPRRREGRRQGGEQRHRQAVRRHEGHDVGEARQRRISAGRSGPRGRGLGD